MNRRNESRQGIRTAFDSTTSKYVTSTSAFCKFPEFKMIHSIPIKGELKVRAAKKSRSKNKRLTFFA